MKRFAIKIADVRACAIGGSTLFLLVAADGACAVLAFDLERGVQSGKLEVDYIKHDNGGGTLTASPDGARIALGSEFQVRVYAHEQGELRFLASLDADQQHTEAGLFVGPHHVVRRAERRLMARNLETGEVHYSSQPDIAYGGLVVDPSASALLAINPSRVPSRIDFESLEPIERYPARDGRASLIGARDGYAYLRTDDQLIRRHLASGQELAYDMCLTTAHHHSRELAVHITPEHLIVAGTNGIATVDLTQDRISFTAFEDRPRAVAYDRNGQLWLVRNDAIERG